MHPRLLDLVVCPIDATPLELVAWDERPVLLTDDERRHAGVLGITERSISTEVETGVLLNRARRLVYPIYRGVPRLLVFRTGVAARFEAEFGDRLARELPKFSLPAQSAQQGEENVLRSFSSEWLGYGWDERTYWDVTADEMFRAMHFMLDLDAKRVGLNRILEVGIGIGGIADYVQRATGAELVGTDLSYAVDAAYEHFGRNRFLHIVQASLFAPPVPDASFDFVYSHGVIHHTFSTEAAFQRISRLPRSGGKLYVWVYSPTQERRTPTRRLLMAMERATRPMMSRLPDAVQTGVLAPFAALYMLQKNALAVAGRRRQMYRWREAMHAARDRFTPPFAHRHDDDEVSTWFEAAGYRDLTRARDRNPPAEVPAHFLTCTGIEGMRSGSPPAAAALPPSAEHIGR